MLKERENETSISLCYSGFLVPLNSSLYKISIPTITVESFNKALIMQVSQRLSKIF